jgi:hypothetical protein
MHRFFFSKAGFFFLLISTFSGLCLAQNSNGGNQPEQRVRTVSIPISIFTKQELKETSNFIYPQRERYAAVACRFDSRRSFFFVQSTIA